MLFLLSNLFLYILFSASFITSFKSWLWLSLVEIPREMFKGIFWSLVFEQIFFILFIASPTSFSVDRGMSIKNSSSPHLAIMSSSREQYFNIFATLFNNL